MTPPVRVAFFMQQQQPEISKAAVLGGGSFGTVLANLLAENGVPVWQWMRNQARALEVQAERENRKYVPGLKLSDGLTVSSDIQQVLYQADLVVLSVPSKAFRQVIVQAKPYLCTGAVIICSAKGIEAGTFKLMHQIMEEELPDHLSGVISGPNLAMEIANKQMTGTVIASRHKAVRDLAQAVFSSSYFRVYANTDLYGVELGGVLKNIYAIMAGMAHSIGVGQNTLSLLMTRSIAEMSRFAVSMGANPMTFIGLAGMGDLIVTCTSPLSRNFRIGRLIGEGLSLEQAIEKVGQTAEGVNTLRLVKEKADEKGIYMPLANGLYNILFKGSTIDQEISALMESGLNSDVEFVLT
jgi:glycerol-3-phosphate dehydrogenase (NAD(P)+)